MYNLRTNGRFVSRSRYVTDALRAVGWSNWIFIFFLLGFFSLYLIGEQPETIEYAQAEEVPAVPKEVRIEVKIDWNRARILKEVEERAKEYGVNPDVMWNTMLCENPDLIPDLQSHIITDGVREDSWGVSQIHLPDHPEITREQAQDPAFAIRFMASEMSEGRAWKWTCWRKLYKNR